MDIWVFWMIAGVIALAATAGLQARGRGTLPGAVESNAAALAIYRDQLAEIDRDLKLGLIGPAESESQKAEIGRRLLAVARERAMSPAPSEGARVPLALQLLVPLSALLLYLQVGAPHLADVPRAERLASAQQTGDLEALLAQVESHLEKKPEDVTGWKLLVTNYQSLGRYADAATALERIIALDGPSAPLLADLAEALTLANQGLMTADAERALGEALKRDPKLPKARYFKAIALLQNGDRRGARLQFQSLLADSPADAPWRQAVTEQLRLLNGAGNEMGPSAADVEAAQVMSPADREAMVRNMVEGLDARLAQDGNDLAGWLRLIRSRVVLNERDKAQEALARARKALAGNDEALAAFNDLAQELKL